jgi:hypothetical protein
MVDETQMNQHNGITSPPLSVWLPAALIMCGGVLVISSIVVLLLSAAYALAQFAAMEIALSLCLVGGAAMGLGFVAIVIAWMWWPGLHGAFDRSRYEWNRNVQWFKTSLQEGTRLARDEHARSPGPLREKAKNGCP